MVVNAKLVLYNSFIVFLGIFLTFLVVIALPIICIYRSIIAVFAKCFRPNLESMVSGMDMLFVGDIGHWDIKQEQALLLTTTLKTSLSYEKVQKFFEGAITNNKNERLQKYIVSWAGFAFWKKETNFSLDNHIFTLDYAQEVKYDNLLNNLIKQLLKKPFASNQSPWEAYILRNYEVSPGSENQTVFILRFHHALFDGHSCLKLFSDAYNNYVPIEYENLTTANRSAKCIRDYVTKIYSPYKLLKLYLQSTDLFSRPWSSFSGDISAGQTKISVEKILLLRRKYGIAFYPIVLSGITAALRNILLRTSSRIPEKIHVGFPTPTENHPEYICNHLSGVSFPLPVGISDPVQRLVNINTQFENVNSSQLSQFSANGVKFLGSFPHWISTKLSKVHVSGMVTIFSSGAKQEFLGCPITEISGSYHVPLPQLNAGIAIVGVINDGSVYLRGTFDKNILPSDEMAKEIMKYINEHFDSLLEN